MKPAPCSAAPEPACFWLELTVSSQAIKFPLHPGAQTQKPSRSIAPLSAPVAGSLRRAHPCGTKRRDAAVVYAHGSPLIPAAGKGFAELQTLRSRHWVAGQEERVAVGNPRQLL